MLHEFHLNYLHDQKQLPTVAKRDEIYGTSCPKNKITVESDQTVGRQTKKFHQFFLARLIVREFDGGRSLKALFSRWSVRLRI